MILVANLGNRNILFENEPYSSYKNPDSFRNWSLNLLDKYAESKNKISLNIINPLLTEKPKPEKIFLLFSDQTRYETKTDQDTLYEAKIIKNILIDKYNYTSEQIDLVHVQAKVIANDELMIFYGDFLRNKIKPIIDQENKLILCDAGGTPQQKMSLKLMAEFVLKPELYEIKYTENNQLISDVKIDVYRKIISREQAIELIKQGEYQAAANLLDYTEIHNFHNQKEWHKKIFAHGFFRFYQNKELAEKNLAQLKKKDKERLKLEYSYFDNYLNNTCLSNNQEFRDVFTYDTLQEISEYLQKSLFYFALKKYSASILSFSQFYELFFESVISIEFPKETYGDSSWQNEAQSNKFKKDFKQQTEHSLKICEHRYRKDGYEIGINKLACRILIAKSVTNKSILKIAELVSPYVTYTDDAIDDKQLCINVQRNKIAHEGRYISEIDIEEKLNYYPQLLESIKNEFQFIDSTNVFNQINEIIENTLRKTI